MQISKNFDGGNIRYLGRGPNQEIRLEICRDQGCEFMQWFYFRLSGRRGERCVMRIENAGAASFPGGWQDYRAVASYDREEWFRVPTEYADGCLSISHTPARDLVYFAYFAPYSLERHATLLAKIQHCAAVQILSLGKTLDDRDIDLVRVGDPSRGTLRCWIVARQHPGETMAAWWIEGFLERLLDPLHALSRVLLEKVTFFVVPNMNPDGSFRGHLRTNAAGVNLNRVWDCPSLETSPEVFHVARAMQAHGCDFALDVHGEEVLPHAFIAGGEGAPRFSDRHARLLARFKTTLEAENPDFQQEFGYQPDSPGAAHLGKCAKFVTNSFDCLAMTLEMPFKDNARRPDAKTGWSPARCKRLGAAGVDAIMAVADHLRSSR